MNITRNTVANQYVQPNISNKTGFTVGAIVNYSISSIFSIQSELVYNQRGLKKNLEESLIRTDYLDYIEIPIHAILEIPGCQIKPFLLFGVNTGYLLKASATYNDLGSTSPVNTTEEYKRINVALDGGAGV